ncbi:MAG: NAD(P)H-dependent oxidoreductase [Pseudomonadota bacterium]
MKTLVFLGSLRDSAPPSPARLGARVAAATAGRLGDLGAEVTLIDPLNLDLPQPFKPHFAYAPSKVPAVLADLAAQIEGAEAFVAVSPEYNHSMSPALADLLNHFGSSLFSFKPSAIVTYSAGQWGGARAAVQMRTFLAELGCLPVSAMVHIPHAQDVFDKDGRYSDGVDAPRWDAYLDRSLTQLQWWAEAARAQRDVRPGTQAFKASPQERNAP